jgi:methionyl-tRNA formyltransferase
VSVEAVVSIDRGKGIDSEPRWRGVRVIFMGTPEFAVPTLRALHAYFTVVGVMTQADKPRGRGLKTVPTPVKSAALELGLHVEEPQRLSSPDTLNVLRQWNPDVIVVAAYGKILPESILKLPPMGCVNLHASLLPRHRGASPINEAILAGDKTTGVCTILMDRGMDTGDLLLSTEVPVMEDDTAGTLHDRLLEPGAALVVETLKAMKESRIHPTPQNHGQATYTSTLSKEDGRLDWRHTAQSLGRQVRAMNPWPGAFCHLSGEVVKIWSASPVVGSGEPGRVVRITGEGVLIGTGEDLLLVTQVQAPSRKRVGASEFARARGLKEGSSLDPTSDCEISA